MINYKEVLNRDQEKAQVTSCLMEVLRRRWKIDAKDGAANIECHFQPDNVNDSATDKQSKTHSFRSGSPTWSSKSSMCGSDRTGFASSSRMSDTHTSDGHPAYRGHRLAQVSVSGGAGAGGRSELSADDQLDTFSVTSGGSLIYPGLSEVSPVVTCAAGAAPANARLYLTPAQMALQQQLKSKHAELSRRIAMQQAELLRYQS